MLMLIGYFGLTLLHAQKEGSRQQLDDRLAGINQGGFMVSLPSKSLVLKSRTGASKQLGALPVGCCNFVFWWVLS